jgi:hypothetical protein
MKQAGETRCIGRSGVAHWPLTYDVIGDLPTAAVETGHVMAANRGLAGATLADVVVQLLCEKCRQRPIAVALVNDPASEAPGRWGAGGWRVVLIEADQTAPP